MITEWSFVHVDKQFFSSVLVTVLHDSVFDTNILGFPSLSPIFDPKGEKRSKIVTIDGEKDIGASGSTTDLENSGPTFARSAKLGDPADVGGPTNTKSVMFGLVVHHRFFRG